VAYDSNQMSRKLFQLGVRQCSRRLLFWSLGSAFVFSRQGTAQSPEEDSRPNDHKLKFPGENEDPRLPNGKSQKNAIAKDQHEQALKDADQLVAAAEDLRAELRKAGTFVVPLSSVKKTEEIEKLAKRIRGRLKS